MKLVEKKTHYGVKSNSHPSIKAVDMTGREVTAIANTYNFMDDMGDVLVGGCCKRSIRESGPNSKAVAKIKHLMHHDLERPVGKLTELAETEEGGREVLLFTSFLPETREGDDALTNYKADVYDNHSIGFNYVDVEFIERDAKNWEKTVAKLINPEEAERRGYLWLVKELRLWEVSTVSFGANRLTPALGIKGDAMDRMGKIQLRIDAISRKLRADSMSVEAVHDLKLQLSQIKQLIAEANESEDPRRAAKITETPLLFGPEDVALFKY